MSDLPLSLRIEAATLSDLDDLLSLEQRSFNSDQLSRRSFRHLLQHGNCDLLIARSSESQCLAYALILYRKGSRFARLYSMAVCKKAQGLGVAKSLLLSAQKGVGKKGCNMLRLEVNKENEKAIGLYQSCGFKIFGEYLDYYQDHGDAYRMQKSVANA